MAASLLRRPALVLGIKTLQFQAWGLQRLPTTVFLCTKSEERGEKSERKHSAKKALSSTKPDGAVKLADEDLRKFLARKTLITFPQKTLVRESISSTGKKLADEDSSSSSSSDSDSSSDSEEEDNALKDTVKTKVSFPRREPISFENKTKKIKIRTEKHFLREQDKDGAPYSLSSAESSVKQKGLNQATADDKLLKSNLGQTTKQRPSETSFKSFNLEINLAGQPRPTKVASKQLEASSPEVTSSKQSTDLMKPQQNVAQNLALLKEGKNAAVKIEELESQGSDASVQQEEAVSDRTSVVETMKEGIIPEAGVRSEQQSTPQEAKPTVATPQEDFDTSTYKNLQHHEYTPFTFVDFDVELSKFRQPQPSSGRISPRH